MEKCDGEAVAETEYFFQRFRVEANKQPPSTAGRKRRVTELTTEERRAGAAANRVRRGGGSVTTIGRSSVGTAAEAAGSQPH